MNTSRKDYELGSPEAAALWRRVRAAPGPQGVAAPDSLTIAAHVDGTLDPSARDQVEAWMAASPEALDLITAARSEGAEPYPPAPARLLARARGLVGDRSGQADMAPGGILAWFAGLTQPSVWAATTAAMLVAAVISFELGREATVRLVLVTPAQAEDGVDFGPSADDLL